MKTQTKSKRGRKPVISFSGIRWDRMTDREVAEKLYNDPVNAGKIKASTIANFKVTVFLKRKALAASGRNVLFKGRVVSTPTGKVKKTKWVRAKV